MRRIAFRRQLAIKRYLLVTVNGQVEIILKWPYGDFKTPLLYRVDHHLGWLQDIGLST